MIPNDIDEFRETPIIGYLAHKDGRVYSQRSNKLLKPFKTKAGYLQLKLDRKSHYLHHIIYSTFRGIRPKRVLFLDKNPLNCAYENLHNPTGDFAEIQLEE